MRAISIESNRGIAVVAEQTISFSRTPLADEPLHQAVAAFGILVLLAKDVAVAIYVIERQELWPRF
jgi:hypothetical protein